MIDRPVLQRVGEYGYWKLGFHVEVQGTKHYNNRHLGAEQCFFDGLTVWPLKIVCQCS